jgi:hypothetical protein
VILSYDPARYPFARLLRRDVFRVRDLGQLHAYLREYRRSLGGDGRPGTADNLALRRLMQDLADDSPFYQLYRLFMLRVLAPVVGRPLTYSSHPKMRVHLDGTGSVSSFHHDIVVTRRIDQVNFWLPFTDVSGSAALWLESDYGRGDYAPVPVRYGEVLIFDGGYLGHGSVPNRSGTTRVSMDMRFGFKGATTRAESIELMTALARRLPSRDQAPPSPGDGAGDAPAGGP